MLYLILKALHLIAVVGWFACLLYLPRLFVYHAQSTDDVSKERFMIMEYKLYFYIGTPAMIVSIAFGIGMLAVNTFLLSAPWLLVKIALVVILVGYHLCCQKIIERFSKGQNIRSHVWYRWYNEVPTILLIAIVFLAVLKPF